MDLLKAIQLGENKNLEFKAEMPSSQAIAKSVVAFSNTAGGKIIIGINDQGVIAGLKSDVDVFEMQDQIASIIYDSCYPNILPDIYPVTIQDCLVLVVEIFRGNLLPYYLKKHGKADGVYIRVGATNRKASHENILELERQRMNISFDQETDRTTDLSQLDLTPLSDHFARLDKAFNLTVMKNLKLVHEENGHQYPTHGLLILLGRYDHVRMKCSRFKGKSMDLFIDRKEYSGDLFSQLENTENFIKNHISLSSVIKGLQREDQYEIPLEAIRESLVNAVVHRDYVNDGRDIKIGVYDDLVNIVSPGAFPSTITQEDLLEGRSEARNKVIARVFKELNFIEQWGSGIRRIKSSCLARGLKEPEIIEKGDFVDVSLYREKLRKRQPAIEQSVSNKQEEIILEYLRLNNNRLTTKRAMSILGLGERRSREILNKMIKSGLLERIGKTTNTYYCTKS